METIVCSRNVQMRVITGRIARDNKRGMVEEIWYWAAQDLTATDGSTRGILQKNYLGNAKLNTTEVDNRHTVYAVKAGLSWLESNFCDLISFTIALNHC